MTEASTAELQTIDAEYGDAIRFFRMLFGRVVGGTIHTRAVAEPKDGRQPTNHHYELGEDFPGVLARFLDYCTTEGRAAFFLPGTVRVDQAHKGTGKADVLSIPAICLDLDKGDTAEALAGAEGLIGPATIVVESGGTTDHGSPKRHVWWVLESPAVGTEIDEVCRIREALAKQFGGDPAFKQPAQVIRIPGSWHLKSAPKRVRLATLRPERTYSLAQVSRAVGVQAPASNVVNLFDFNSVAPDDSSVERALTAPVHESGVDELTRFDAAGKAIGHFLRMVRENRYTMDQAWQAAKDWNAATLVPPWPEDRLRNDFERLARIDLETNGPVFVPQAVLTGQPSGLRLEDWYTHKRFKGEAPARRWLVSDMIPLGTPGVFAAVGDAGKSMLALKLANVVANYPASHDGPLGPIDTPSFFGRPVVGRGTAVVLTGEDDADEVHRRLNTIAPHRASGETESRLIVCPLLSAGGARAFIRDSKSGPEFTPFWQEIRTQIEQVPDLALVVFDPLTLFVGGDTSDNAIGAALMGELNALAAKTGAAVMIVHHFAKGARIGGLSDARNAVLGAGAWINNGRWGVVMWEAEQGEANSVLKKLGQAERARHAGVVYFGGLTKSNAPGAKELRTLVRGAAGVLEDVTDAIRAATPKSAEVDEMLYRGLLEMKAADPHFSFTSGKGALWSAWEAIIRARDLPITKDGSGKAENVQSVFARLLKGEKLKPLQGGKGRTPHFEPV